MKKLFIVVLLLAGCGYAGSQGYDWVNNQVQAPMSTRSQPVTIHIDEGESPDVLAQDLKDKGLVHNKDVFLYYLRYTGARSHLQAGDFVLNKNMNMAQIIDVLQHAKPSQVAVRLPEGLTLQQMAAEAEKDGLGKAATYLAAANDSSWDYAFLKERQARMNLEGFLFPDTYLLDKSAGPRDLVKTYGQYREPTLEVPVKRLVACLVLRAPHDADVMADTHVDVTLNQRKTISCQTIRKPEKP